ncbi:hypothetical protein GCM10011360_05420 [Primorskyibacter flagellatus]|uniref:Uncharacterized protein n=1 Tax=Primorskyibacter flagellatus TaxID=1387277 RepID=A0A917EAL7_9RHOB|nr:hypothetical protein [Primorskyibacter flagellatus]GGE19586.1 hypothetical protein GCM10011360_05420 [Primorskyibacter flagellatus]
MQRTMILPVTLMMSGIYFWTRLLTGKTSDTSEDAYTVNTRAYDAPPPPAADTSRTPV